MRRILFVDDEQQILDGMRNMLRKNRHVWEMVFVSSGAAALAEMEKAPFDVIISDMRMPQMDGAMLLSVVREKYPRTARFVLSGQADHEAIYRALQYSQQFMSKPCDPTELLQVVQRTCKFQECVHQDEVREAVGKLDQLPSNHHLYLDLVQSLQDPDVATSKLVQIIEQDPAMATKMLQLVNSAFFGLAKKTNSIGQAISFLGIDLVKSLTLSLKVFSHFEDPHLRGLVDQIQAHSFAVARLATALILDRKEWEQLYTIGLLHDVGVLALVQSQQETYREVLQAAESGQMLLSEVEKQLSYVEHAAVGGYLLGVWGLPFDVAEGVLDHHQPSRCEGLSLNLLAIHFADLFLECGPIHKQVDDFLDWEAVERLGAKDMLQEWKRIASAQVGNVNQRILHS